MRYLNREARERYIILGYIVTTLPEIIDRLGLTKELASRVRCAHTHCKKVFEEYTATFNPKQAMAVVNTLKNNDIKVVAKTDMSGYNVMLTDGEDAIYTLADYAVGEKCMKCPCGEEVVKNCELKKILLELALPVVKEDCQKGECPYSFKFE